MFAERERIAEDEPSRSGCGKGGGGSGGGTGGNGGEGGGGGKTAGGGGFFRTMFATPCTAAKPMPVESPALHMPVKSESVS